MEHLNEMLFLLINAGPQASGLGIATARWAADSLIWIVPAGFVVAWLRGSVAMRQSLLTAAVAAGAGLMTNYVIGLVWYHPRPFAMGLGRTLIDHVADSSFPSDHMTLIWAAAFTLVTRKRLRLSGWGLVVIGLVVAWARVYTGVHFPLDMVGAALVAVGSTWLALTLEDRWIAPIMPGLAAIHRTVFAPLIRRGWVRE